MALFDRNGKHGMARWSLLFLASGIGHDFTQKDTEAKKMNLIKGKEMKHAVPTAQSRTTDLYKVFSNKNRGLRGKRSRSSGICYSCNSPYSSGGGPT